MPNSSASEASLTSYIHVLELDSLGRASMHDLCQTPLCVCVCEHRCATCGRGEVTGARAGMICERAHVNSEKKGRHSFAESAQ